MRRLLRNTLKHTCALNSIKHYIISSACSYQQALLLLLGKELHETDKLRSKVNDLCLTRLTAEARLLRLYLNAMKTQPLNQNIILPLKCQWNIEIPLGPRNF